MDNKLLLAMELNQALELCLADEQKVEVHYTSPPWGKSNEGFRVIRCQQKLDDVLVLTAAREMEGQCRYPK